MSKKPSPEKKNLPTSETLLVLCKALRRFIDKKIKGKYIAPNPAQLPKELRTKNNTSKEWKYYFENENPTTEDRIHDVLKDNIFLQLLQSMDSDLEKVVGYLENNKKNIECLDNMDNNIDREMRLNLFDNLRNQLNRYFGLNDNNTFSGNCANTSNSVQLLNDKIIMDSIQKLNILQNKNEDNNKDKNDFENENNDEEKIKNFDNFENDNKDPVDSEIEDLNNFLGYTEYNNSNNKTKQEKTNNNNIDQLLNKKKNRENNNNNDEENGIEKYNQSTPSKKTVNSTESNKSRKKTKKNSKKNNKENQVENNNENQFENNNDYNNNIIDKEKVISLNELESKQNNIPNEINIPCDDQNINKNINNPRELSFEKFLYNYYKKQPKYPTEKQSIILKLISKLNNPKNFSISLVNKEINGPFLVGSYKHMPNQLELINYSPNIDILFTYSNQKLDSNSMNVLVKETLTENLKLNILDSETIDEKTNTIKISNKCIFLDNIEIYIDIFFIDISKNNNNNEKIVKDLIFNNKLYDDKSSNQQFNILMLFFRQWRRKYKLFNIIPEFIDEIINYDLEEHQNQSLSVNIFNVFFSLYKGIEDFIDKKKKGIVTSSNKNIIEKLMNVIYCNIKNKENITKAVINATDFIKKSKYTGLFEEINDDN